jgi:CRISPR-associated protein Cmr1
LKKAQWQAGTLIPHSEVHRNIDAFLYMGYGPITLPRGATTTTLKANAAIQAGESTGFRLAYPEGEGKLLEQALWLMDRFGTLGGRSRNGWGSFSLQPESGAPLAGTLPLREWTDCLDRDWPHAIGKDTHPLIWQIPAQTDWKKVMVELARLKIGLRTYFRFPDEKPPHRDALSRHWLSYPITKHSTHAFPKDARLPNSLRFKVRQTGNNQFVGVVFHVPCLPPAAFHPNRVAIEDIWQQVHRFLDAQNNLSRIQE